MKKLKDLPWDADVMLKTVEISFDRTCNFACSYCNAGYSTTWGKDIKTNGAYQNFKTSSAQNKLVGFILKPGFGVSLQKTNLLFEN